MSHEAIGACAGMVWHALAAKKSASVAALAKAVKTDTASVHQAIGWLAREGKIVLEKRGKTVTVALAESELPAAASVAS